MNESMCVFGHYERTQRRTLWSAHTPYAASCVLIQAWLLPYTWPLSRFDQYNMLDYL